MDFQQVNKVRFHIKHDHIFSMSCLEMLNKAILIYRFCRVL